MTLPTAQAPARQKLMDAALQLFVSKGYEAASTRDIAELAGVNISSIRYYFGDKAGLYRAVYTEPLKDMPKADSFKAYEQLPLEDALKQLYRDFLEPLKRGDVLRHVMRLHFREMIEPTGAWQHEIEAEIKPQQDMLCRMLARRFGLSRPDIEVHRLAFCLMGMAIHFYLGQDVVDAIAPAILKDSKAIDVLADRLACYAVGMVHAEGLRRDQLHHPRKGA